MFGRNLRLLLALATLCALGLARKPGERFQPGWNLFSREHDVQLGQQAAAQVRKQVQIAPNQELQEYFQRLGKRLASQPEAGNYPYTFTVIVDPSINAFALPGGPTFMNHGLLLAADNEAQIAGVIAHEISHVALRHGTNQMSKANLMQIPAILTGVATGSNLLAQLTQLGATGVMLKFSRGAETQADLTGVRIMAQAGYNPIEMANFFEKLEAEGGSRAPQFLSDHPNPGNRVKAIQEELPGLPRGQYNTSVGDFNRMKALAREIRAPGRQVQVAPAAPPVAAPSPESVTPSGGFKQYAGHGFAFSYPDNWEVVAARETGVTVAPRAGVIPDRGLGYGIMASFYKPRSARNLDDATKELYGQLKQGNPSLQQRSHEGRRMQIDGSSALLVSLANASPFGGAETNALLTVERPEGLFYMLLISPERDFVRLQPAFDQVIRSLRFSN